MADYAHLLTTAQRLIDKNGRNLVLHAQSETPSDGSKPWRANTPTDVVSHTAKGVVIDYTEEEVDGTRIMRGDKRCLLADRGDLSPDDFSIFDTLEDSLDSSMWKILSVELVAPGPTRLVCILHLRK